MTRKLPALGRLAAAVGLALACAGTAAAQTATAVDPSRIEQLEKLVQQQARQLESMQKTLQAQEQTITSLQHSLQDDDLHPVASDRLGALRGEGLTPGTSAVAATGALSASSPGASGAPSLSPAPGAGMAASTTAALAASPEPAPAPQDAQQPVGQRDQARPQVAQIFDQPGVLTPRGKFVIEPSVQMSYSSTDRVALVGYTIIPAILIGLIDVRQVKTTTATAILSGRYGVTNRFELEGRIPYVYTSADTVSREIFTGSAQDKVFNAHGSGLGDVEVTARYQLNQGGPDKAYYVGWLRYKSRTGKDLFEVTTDCVTRCVANATGTGLPLELPTGSGFHALQPGITWLYASDPVVFFGSLSYLHNFKRSNVSRTVLTGAPEGQPQTTTDLIGDLKAGDIIGMNIGLGLALNEKAAISIGYDQSFVGKTESNGEELPGSVRVMLGTLLLGGSYRFNDRMSLNVSLGVGVTRDTPDTTLMVRLPITF
ncbi:acetate kinase [Lysobacter xanthus]